MASKCTNSNLNLLLFLGLSQSDLEPFYFLARRQRVCCVLLVVFGEHARHFNGFALGYLQSHFLADVKEMHVFFHQIRSVVAEENVANTVFGQVVSNLFR